MAYDHGAFRVRDLEAAVRFYTEKLGFQFLFYSGSEEAGEKGAFLDYRGARLELIETIGASYIPVRPEDSLEYVGTVTGAANETALGMLAGGVIPVAKHFPGHGDTETDSHLGLPVVDKTREELLDFELRPFRQAIDTTCVFGAYGGDTSIPAIMVGHILLSQVDPDKPATLSSEVVTGLLREELGFDGVVVTDDLTMGAITQNYGLGEAAVLAVEAGCDLLLVCHEAGSVEEVYAALLDAVDTGRISVDRLDQSVRRILTLKQSYGLTNDPVDLPDLDALNAQVDVVNGLV